MVPAVFGSSAPVVGVVAGTALRGEVVLAVLAETFKFTLLNSVLSRMGSLVSCPVIVLPVAAER